MDTKIEWADASWSPWRGCTKVSPGCAHCYAETLSRRNPAVLGEWGKGKPRVLAKNWNEPGRWSRQCNRDLVCLICGGSQATGRVNDQGYCLQCELEAWPRKKTVFPSLCDWLDEEVPVEWLVRFLQLIRETPNLRWLLLTKRPERWLRRVEAGALSCLEMRKDPGEVYLREWIHEWVKGRPPSNVWVGTSVEDQQRANERIPALLRIPAAGRFLSVEPLLGPVNFRECEGLMDAFRRSPYGWHNWLRRHLHWVIVGGESGRGARACHVDWVRGVVQQCLDAQVPCFVKQLGAFVVDRNDAGYEGDSLSGWPMDTDTSDCIEPGVWQGKPVRVHVRHPKGSMMSEWPVRLRVREFPEDLRK